MADNKMKSVEMEDGQSTDIVSENIERMKNIFPDAFTEGGVNFDTLRQLLGDAKVLDEGEEKYGLNWHGKKKARQIALTPSTGTLLPCPEESVDWDTTKNLFIEGDNLEVLKLLQKSYANKVKMIYIDPPYNTGKEFVYPDNYQENLDTYLRYTGQLDDEGMKFSSNTESSGRQHTNWINMIYPRLKVARNLLSQDGVIFISIDDNEQANLREVCDEIFGAENFIANIIWQKKFSRSNDAEYFSTMHDHILCYAKSSSTDQGWVLNLLPRGEEVPSGYGNLDNDERGLWTSVVLSTKSGTEKLKYEITTPSGRVCIPPDGRFWGVSENKFQELVRDNRIWFGKNCEGIPRLKTFLSEVQSGLRPNTIWLHRDVGHNQEGRQEVKALFEGKGYFDGPKPVRLIDTMLKITSDKKSFVVLDFFAGSGTTAHAVMKQNAEDNGNRRFISIQLPEPLDEKSDAAKAGYETIADISKGRIGRAGIKIKEDHPESGCDLGFKVFKLSNSNITVWNPDRANIEESLLSHEEHLIEGRTEQDVLYELLLKRGVDLSVPIESREVSGKNFYSIGYGVLFACLDKSITSEQVENIAQGIIDWYTELAPSSETHVFFRDSAFRDDVSKTNMAAILGQNGITHVRSL